MKHAVYMFLFIIMTAALPSPGITVMENDAPAYLQGYARTL